MAAISVASSIGECNDPEKCKLAGVDHELYSRDKSLKDCFFILGNPSKLVQNPEMNTNYIRIFQSCIACGTSRFHDDDWYGKLDATIDPTSCKNEKCIAEIARANFKNLIPYELLYLDYPKS